MPSINWENKTGLTEVQLLQVIAALLVFAGHHYGYEQIAINAGVLSTTILGAVGLYLRRKDKDNAQ
jgi:hypothetical protein